MKERLALAVNNVPFYGDDPFGVDQAPVTPDFGSFQTVGSGKLMVVIFIVDASRSMRGDRIAAVNAALTELMYELKQIQSDNGLDMKISIMTFTSDAKWVLQNVPVDEVLLHTIETRVGLTNYGEAFKELNLVLTKDRFMAHTGKVAPPAIMFMTDGEPCDDYQHDLEILLKNGWFANANRSAVLIGDAINHPDARAAVEQFVENANDDIVTAEDSSTIVHRLKLATLHTVAGTPLIDGAGSPAQGGAAGGQAAGTDPSGNPFGGNSGPGSGAGTGTAAGGSTGGAPGGSADPFGNPFGDPFADPFAGGTGSAGGDPFSGGTGSAGGADPFGGTDPFAGAGSAGIGSTGGDPFGGTDPFAGATGTGSGSSGTGNATGVGAGSSGVSTGSSGSVGYGAGSAGISNDPFASVGGSSADPFASVGGSSDPFGGGSSDPFGGSSSDPFGGGGSDPFGGGGSDPFGGSGSDPFGGSGSDPFGDF